MCGIVGYLGYRKAYDVLIKGLKRLEYRGYDSAGVALINEGNNLSVYKAKGKVANLEEFCSDKDITGTVGIAHTRWATHGEPSSTNAHPHYSQSHNLAMIHNGIIENYADIKNKLSKAGVEFQSETDTEVFIQLIEYIQRSQKLDLLSSVQLAMREVIGAYAIAILDKSNPDCIIAARKQSPLVVGVGEKEFFIASDASPIVEFTNQVVYLDDENVAVIERGKELRIVSKLNAELHPEIHKVELNIGQIEKGGYPHFMLKEIFEQPDCLRTCMRGRVSEDAEKVILSALIDYKKELVNAKRYIIVACGTSWHAALIGKQLIEEYSRVPVEVEYASEFRYRNPIVGKGDVVLAISQSGETADTLAALQLAKNRGAFIFGICNAIGSSIARETSTGIYIHVGPEIGVASTKAFTGQVTVLSMFAVALGKEKGMIRDADYKSVLKGLNDIPGLISKVLKQNDKISLISRTFTYARNFLYLGRGINYPVALEGALKLKEISYIHAEGYPAAEMKHGPIALIDSDMPVVAIALNSPLYEKILSNIQEIKARKGKVIAVVSEGDEKVSKIADEVIEIPNCHESLTPLLTVIPLQLLAYHIATCKGKDVDQPRNLAKSVTVE
ncbi:MAG: glutamine--fructose-6-phosphate transaminase (isomerizing) [Bacteroidaceae bacterium]|nr:glutamine--fructose-6-phosphate transaminase (isomerizing) [Bacteroidaceae bacterium]